MSEEDDRRLLEEMVRESDATGPGLKHIEIESVTLKSTGKTLKIPTGKPDPDAPLTGPFGMVITKTKCPSCGSEDLDTVAKASTKGWGRRCQSCEAIWGVDEATDDSPGLVHVHTGEAVRQLMGVDDG